MAHSEHALRVYIAGFGPINAHPRLNPAQAVGQLVGRQLSRAWEPGLISGTAGRVQRLHKLGVNQFWYAAGLCRGLPFEDAGRQFEGLPLGSRRVTIFQIRFVGLSHKKFPKTQKPVDRCASPSWVCSTDLLCQVDAARPRTVITIRKYKESQRRNSQISDPLQA
jgi:hypothetical protein